MIKGRRTYICLTVACGAYFARQFFPQYVSQEVADLIMGFFGFGSVAALRLAVVDAISQAAAMPPPGCPTDPESAGDYVKADPKPTP